MEASPAHQGDAQCVSDPAPIKTRQGMEGCDQAEANGPSTLQIMFYFPGVGGEILVGSFIFHLFFKQILGYTQRCSGFFLVVHSEITPDSA